MLWYSKNKSGKVIKKYTNELKIKGKWNYESYWISKKTNKKSAKRFISSKWYRRRIKRAGRVDKETIKYNIVVLRVKQLKNIPIKAGDENE